MTAIITAVMTIHTVEPVPIAGIYLSWSSLNTFENKYNLFEQTRYNIIIPLKRLDGMLNMAIYTYCDLLIFSTLYVDNR